MLAVSNHLLIFHVHSLQEDPLHHLAGLRWELSFFSPFEKWMFCFTLAVSEICAGLPWLLKHDGEEPNNSILQFPQDTHKSVTSGSTTCADPCSLDDLTPDLWWVVLHSPSPCLFLLHFGWCNCSTSQGKLRNKRSWSSSALSISQVTRFPISLWRGPTRSLPLLFSPC